MSWSRVYSLTKVQGTNGSGNISTRVSIGGDLPTPHPSAMHSRKESLWELSLVEPCHAQRTLHSSLSHCLNVTPYNTSLLLPAALNASLSVPIQHSVPPPWLGWNDISKEAEKLPANHLIYMK